MAANGTMVTLTSSPLEPTFKLSYGSYFISVAIITTGALLIFAIFSVCPLPPLSWLVDS